ncbi:uncharacterized protein TNCV_2878031 [Trichonephila clavipes]|uniref:Reverse transcriptase domain-containing protein n=1 Tax=Trichonephila clavipes TaxID=2585209 RepID=A0A8X6W271_TRICX|nr:uncharacterized protein TNCV_2878031 [Trichonephila clavipes]
MKFHLNAIGVIFDIGKDFLQISVAEKDQDFLKFLWWEDYKKKKFEIFRHCRLVFGLTCSPFILAAVLNYHLEETKKYFPDTSEKLKNSFYVDNCVTSVCGAEELSHFIQEAKQLLAMACFDLRGWEHTLEPIQIHLAEPTQVLGLLWNRNEDVLFCNLQSADFKPGEYTRSILCTTQKIFDPLGILCPVTICLKIMIKESWKLKIGWDEILPTDLQKKFQTLTNQLPLLADVTISRCVKINRCTEGISLHTFCDASKTAYSTVMFLRKTSGENIEIFFIQTKSRVAPLKDITIPRLELLACCIGARLTLSIRKARNLENILNLYWTYSSTALYWIQHEDH